MRYPFQDKTGKRYGMLSVVRLLDERNPRGRRQYLCRCDCGNESIITQNNLWEHGTKSCGCLHKTNHYTRKKMQT